LVLDLRVNKSMQHPENQPGVPVTVRYSVRVLLFDPADRVLLFAHHDDGRSCVWFLPGGGREAGETPEDTARRELSEETGLTDVEIGPELWRRRFLAAWDGTSYDVRERCFLVRIGAGDIDTDGFTELERRSIVGHRWWTVDELMTTTDQLRPDNLADLVDFLIRDGPPDRPIQQ
jgi:8-oxo-dGTP pyrophosphatase MutT (NUDIX family)